ncbi:MAG: hypothetical protein GY911_11190 [Actinomycetales bacterium]|nr:hypothetical protein [Actinomycetales bacterium]
MSSIFRSQIWSVLALSGGLATAADAGIIITLTDNGDDTIGFSMSGDFTVYAIRSADAFGQFGSYFNPAAGTISNVDTSDEMRQFEFEYSRVIEGTRGSGVAAEFGSSGYAPVSFTGSGHVFQNFLNATICLSKSLTSNLPSSGPVNGGVISGISGSGTYVGSFASAGITLGTGTTMYGSDENNFDTVTIITQTASASAVPGPLSLAIVGAGVGLSRRRRSR